MEWTDECQQAFESIVGSIMKNQKLYGLVKAGEGCSDFGTSNKYTNPSGPVKKPVW